MGAVIAGTHMNSAEETSSACTLSLRTVSQSHFNLTFANFWYRLVMPILNHPKF